MKPEDLTAVLTTELARIAPDADVAHLDPDADLREALDLDSMDFLALMVALNRRLRISVPEADYPRLSTLRGASEYLAERAP